MWGGCQGGYAGRPLCFSWHTTVALLEVCNDCN
nr:MAG TPA: hypothetical protein [Caudoviricetes sp.]